MSYSCMAITCITGVMTFCCLETPFYRICTVAEQNEHAAKKKWSVAERVIEPAASIMLNLGVTESVQHPALAEIIRRENKSRSDIE